MLIDQAHLPSVAMELHLCMGEVDKARALLIERLADENTRGWALAYAQPRRDEARTPLSILLRPLAQQVRTAPDVVAAANKLGRILPAPVLTTMPKGFDPFRARPGAQPVGRDET